jgi:hypothetical protein
VARFLVTYYGGGGMPSSEEEAKQVMAAFVGWASSVPLADPGAPIKGHRTVTASGVNDRPVEGEIGGYSVLEASDITEAVRHVQSHPFLQRGGTLQVCDPAELPGMS